ncbi:MAG: DUF6712 family protein [Janthinobacterium lividum]
MLLKDITELKSYVALDTDGILPSFALELTYVEASVIRPLLGGVLHTWLQAAYDAPGFDPTGTGLAAQLLRAVQAPLARLAVAYNITLHMATIDETGVHITSNDKSKTAFQWQTNQMQAFLLKRGYLGLDDLVAWLEEYRDDSPELKAWAASAAGQRHRRELFTSTAEFNEWENISNSRQVFEALRPMRRRMESFELQRVLGAEFLQELREQVRVRDVSSENQMLLSTYVLPALACLTIGHAVPELGLRLTGEGIDLAIARFDDANAKEADAGLDQLLASKANTALMDADRYLHRLADYLNRTASATRFATYFNSVTYTDPNQVVAPVNTSASKIYKLC